MILLGIEILFLFLLAQFVVVLNIFLVSFKASNFAVGRLILDRFIRRRLIQLVLLINHPVDYIVHLLFIDWCAAFVE